MGVSEPVTMTSEAAASPLWTSQLVGLWSAVAQRLARQIARDMEHTAPEQPPARITVWPGGYCPQREGAQRSGQWTVVLELFRVGLAGQKQPPPSDCEHELGRLGHPERDEASG